jgi:hypothetical protein
MKAGYGILSVEAPDGSHRCPCERRQPIEADIRPVQAVWYKAWPGSQRLFLSPRMAQTQFPLRWWIIHSTVFAYIGSTRLQGRIAAGESLQPDSSCIFKPH